MTYAVNFTNQAKKQYLSLDNSVRERVIKKIKQLEQDNFKSRHLKYGNPCFVEEVGQYRICFVLDASKGIKNIMFIGDHKEYEKWSKAQK
ncbi:hypothetical protein HY989_06745 [Candidatus Micrarchaeota archaeon]|nr:hypothetical protein [Candidatus Micrarchaeota archaeon]